MKSRLTRLICIILPFIFLLSIFTGCAEKSTSAEFSSSSVSDDSIADDISSSLEVTSLDWKETDVDYGGLIFTQEQVDMPDDVAPSGLKLFQNGFFYVTNNLRTNEAVYGTLDEDLNILSSYSLGPATEQSSISFFDVCDDAAYFVRCEYEETLSNVFTQHDTLSRYDFSGNLIWELNIDENFGEKEPIEQLYITGVGALPDGVLLVTQHVIYWIDSYGDVAASVSTDGNYYEPVQSRDGTVYLKSGVSIYQVDHDHHQIGSVILSLDEDFSLLTGSGEYDFLLNTTSKLIGVSFETSTLTNLLYWAECGFSEVPTSIFCLESNVWWIVSFSIVSDESKLIEMRCIPSEDAVEKQTVVMAVPIDVDLTAEDTLGYAEFGVISEFNAENNTYSLEYTAFQSSEELLLMFMSGDVPDLLMFSSTVHQSNAPSEQLLSNKGYFKDFNEFFSADPDISADSFVPGVLETQLETLGALYTLPTCMNFRMMYGRTEYVGTDLNWSMEEFEDILSNVDPEMDIVPYFSNLDFLESSLNVMLGSFIDFQNMTCDFESEEFCALLRICKNYFPSEVNLNDTSVENGTALIDYLSVLSGVGGMAEDIMESTDYASVKGFPGVNGSGGVFTMGKTYAICEGCSTPDGAWEYLKLLLSDNYQENSITPYIPVMKEPFERLIADYCESSDDTRETIGRIESFMENTTTRCIYDSPCIDIILEESTAYFNEIQTMETTCAAIQSRVQTYLWEQS